MVVTDLLIKAKNGTDSFKYYPIAKNIPINLNFALADVREPDKRKASFSKTIELFGTNEINKLFENIFSFNVATQYFNKNLKSPCKYIVDGIENFSGDLQLLKVNIKPDNSIVYECSIIGDSGSIFVDIGDKLITGNADSAEDLDFSAYDHTYDRATQIASRANLGTGTDVLYPFVDRGTNGGSDTIFNVKDFLPCFSLYEYIKKIIENTGRTFTSTFFESAFFKNLIVFPNISDVKLTAAQLSNRQFYVGLNSDLSVSFGVTTTVNHNNESAPFFDVGTQYSAGEATLNDTGFYNIAISEKLKINFTHANPAVTYVIATTILNVRLDKSIDGGATWTNEAIAGLSVFQTTTSYGGSPTYSIATDYFQTLEVATGSVNYDAGNMFRHRYQHTLGNVYYYNSSNVLIGTNDGTVTLTMLSGALGTSFYALATSKSVMEGNAILVNNALPTKIKQKDLLKSTMMAFNLFVELNPSDPNDLIIEPFDEFYNTLPVVDFGNRTDLDKDQTVNPNILEGKRYIYSYKEDKDFYNAKYKESYNEVFGTEQIDVESDFKNQDKITELIFSPTPNIANYGLGIAHPRIYANDATAIKTINQNIRLLYCEEKTTGSPYTYKEYAQTDLLTTDYLYAGHTDDPFNPTLDLNFGFPKEVYYSFPNAYFTDNNLYNAYHKQYLTNLIDRDGKFVTKYLWLTPRDIYNFSFRNRIFVDGAYYIVNKIENYNPIEQDSTKCELIKLLDTPVFTPTSYRLSDTTINTGANILTAKLNSSLNVGYGIQNKGTNCTAIGNNIIIPASCSNVTVIGNNVTVSEGVSNSSVINTNDFNLTESNYSITNSVIGTDLFVIGEVTTNNATPTKLIFDTTTGDFDVQQDQVLRIEVRVLATDLNTLDAKEWVAQGVAIGDSPPTYNVVEAVASTFSDAGIVAATFAIVATGTPGDEFLEFVATGIVATDIIWKAQVEIVKLTI